MSNWKRKQKRKGLHKTSCCGIRMKYKPGYGYVCEKCGRVKEEAQDEY